MNLNEQLTCKYCNSIYNEPVSLNCCGENICRCHINELLPTGARNTFLCPFCNAKSTNLNVCVNKLIKTLVENQLHKLEIDSDYKKEPNRFKAEIGKLETILKDPESFIYEEMHELKRLVDLDREKSKSQLDDLADDLIQQLDTYERKFKEEFKSKNVDLEPYNALVESSKKQLIEYDTLLNFFSNKKKVRDEKANARENMVNSLECKIKKLKDKLFSNLSITYQPIERNKEDLFGKLIIKVSLVKFFLI